VFQQLAHLADLRVEIPARQGHPLGRRHRPDLPRRPPAPPRQSPRRPPQGTRRPGPALGPASVCARTCLGSRRRDDPESAPLPHAACLTPVGPNRMAVCGCGPSVGQDGAVIPPRRAQTRQPCHMPA
jgi:hypothetical protein